MCEHQQPPPILAEQDRERLVRIETRIVKIMEALHLDPRSGVPLIKGQTLRRPSSTRNRKPPNELEDSR